MKFEKKLIILSGDGNAKGSLTLERNAYGVFASFNIFNLSDLFKSEYAIGLKNGEKTFMRRVGSSGRILTRIQIDEMSLENIHCVIFDTATESVLMYGTNSATRLWQGNMMDGFKSRHTALIVSANDEAKDMKPFEYSTRKNTVDDFFLDILPTNSSGYSDNAVASVNYYPQEMNIEIAYSKRKENQDGEITNPLDRAVLNSLNNKELNSNQQASSNEQVRVQSDFEKANGAEEILDDTQELLMGNATKLREVNEQKIQPWEYEKRYLTRHIAYTDGDSIINQANGIINQANGKEQNNEKKAINSDSEEFKTPKTPSVQKTGLKQSGNAEKLGSVRGLKGIHINSKNEEALADETATTVPSASSYSALRATDKTMEYIFYEQVKPQLDELFKANPSFDLLEKIMPDTKWVKVDYDNAGKYYVVGLIGSRPDFLCYGVPAKYSKEPPKELDGYCQWLPLESENPDGEGFWLMFQDAVSGDSIAE